MCWARWRASRSRTLTGRRFGRGRVPRVYERFPAQFSQSPHRIRVRLQQQPHAGGGGVTSARQTDMSPRDPVQGLGLSRDGVLQCAAVEAGRRAVFTVDEDPVQAVSALREEPPQQQGQQQGEHRDDGRPPPAPCPPPSTSLSAQHHIVRPTEGPPARHDEIPAALQIQCAQQYAAAQGEQPEAEQSEQHPVRRLEHRNTSPSWSGERARPTWVGGPGPRTSQLSPARRPGPRGPRRDRGNGPVPGL
ncbi:hypothetical protein RKD18_004225 [Streptomyces phaeoluteigriseus]